MKLSSRGMSRRQAGARVGVHGKQQVRRAAEFCVQTLEGRVMLASVVGINRSSPATTVTGATSLTYAVTFNESVTGVDATDFQVVTTASAAGNNPVVVAGSGAAYTVTVNGVHGSGTLQLNLID